MKKIVNIIMDRIGRITVVTIAMFVNGLIYVKVSEFWAGVFVVFVVSLIGFLIYTDELENL